MAKKDEPAITSATGHTLYMTLFIVGGLILNIAVIALLGSSAG